ncbi:MULTISPECIES: N-acetylmuramoyl-L-alanine amidase [Streptomyces rochei group]|uniref:N-acetylmuramoyl-L-alanine amidase n=2 Tax=Streptomyces TaxID=1883 RepID=UPI0018757523|nr:peptidoglycan recognition family protein [Streptomyces vinaceusdrappus]GHC37352.1 hypothetical protein GCM10010308_64900 [Streptomyces vinaceusdrappus]
MATPLSADALLRALKAEGCQVVEYRSWRTHNRNHKGSWGPVNGVMIHHTVSSGEDSSVALCYNGHASLPGPLCHTVGGKSGKLYMVGHGRANHAGSGDDDVLTAVVNETSLPADNEANTDGNRHFYGLEIVNLGNGKDQYPSVQYDAAVRWAAAICRAHGWNERSVIGHREWQPGKIDPHGPVEGRGNFDMNAFRRDVAERLKHAASWSASSPTPSSPKPQPAPQEDDMPTAKEIADAVWKYPLASPTAEKGTDPNRSAGTFQRWGDRHHADVIARLDRLTAAVERLTAAITKS